MEINIGNFFNGFCNSGLYFIDEMIYLLRDLDIKFEISTLDGYGCFLHQLNHEILHVLLYNLEGAEATLGLDKMKDCNPYIIREFYPLF